MSIIHTQDHAGAASPAPAKLCEISAEFWRLRRLHREATTVAEREAALAQLISLAAATKSRALRRAIARHVNATCPNLQMLVED